MKTASDQTHGGSKLSWYSRIETVASCCMCLAKHNIFQISDIFHLFLSPSTTLKPKASPFSGDFASYPPQGFRPARKKRQRDWDSSPTTRWWSFCIRIFSSNPQKNHLHSLSMTKNNPTQVWASSSKTPARPGDCGCSLVPVPVKPVKNPVAVVFVAYRLQKNIGMDW